MQICNVIVLLFLTACGLNNEIKKALEKEKHSGDAGSTHGSSSKKPDVSFSVPVITTIENSSASLQVELSKPSNYDVVVYLQLIAANPTQLTRFNSLPAYVTVPQGQTSLNVNLVSPDDNIYESTQTFTLILTSIDANTITGQDSVVVSLNDNDGVPSISIANVSGAENSASLNFTVTASRASLDDIDFNWLTSAGTAAAGTDFTAVTSTLAHITAGTTTTNLSVGLLDDSVIEAVKDFSVNLSSPVNATIATATATGTINDDDTPDLQFSATSLLINENSTTAVQVQLSKVASNDVVVNLQFVATLPSQLGRFTAPPATITILQGQSSASFNLVSPDDNVYEGVQTFTLSLTSSDANAVPGQDSIAITLNDDDAIPALSVANISASENSGAMTFTLTTSRASLDDIYVDWQTTAGTASSTTDYTAVATTQAHIVAGATTTTFNVSLLNDGTAEISKTFGISLSNPTNATIGTATATGTITDDDVPSLQFNSTSQSVSEATATATVNLSLSVPAPFDVTIPITVTGTAANPADYTTSPSIPLTILTGNSTASITVTLQNDALNENSETAIFTLGTPTNAVLGTNTTHTVTITDNDPQPSLTLSTAIGLETNSPLNFAATLSTISGRDVTMNYSTTNNTAIAGIDFQNYTNTAFTIPAGALSANIPVNVMNLSGNQGKRKLLLQISSVSGATANNTSVDGIILDNTVGQPPFMLKNINTLANSLTSVTIGNLIYFLGDSTTYGQELWVTDTAAGTTQMVLDIKPGANSSGILNMTAVGSTLYFSADDGTNGRELWKSDGTSAGTVMVKDLQSGSGSSTPSTFLVLGAKLIFTASTTAEGNELFVSDGTVAGTGVLVDIYSGASSSIPQNMTVAGSLLYFTATNTTYGRELWKTDGTTAGTVLVKDTNPGASGASFATFTSFNGKLFFPCTGSGTTGSEPWISDGTTGGTFMLLDIYSGANSSMSSSYKSFELNGKLIFTATEATDGLEPWVTDGTTLGTQLLADITAGASGTSYYVTPQYSTTGLTRVTFQTSVNAVNYDTWSTDGTPGGTSQLVAGFASNTEKTIGTNVLLLGQSSLVIMDNTGAITSKSFNCNLTKQETVMYNLGSKVYFNGCDTATGEELWSSDGTVAGTQLVKDIYNGANSSNVLLKAADSNYVYLLANDGSSGVELWRSDGTSIGTTMIKDINPGSAQGFIYNVKMANNGKLMFTAFEDNVGAGIYVTDGTAIGTNKISAYSNTDGSSSSTGPFIDMNGTPYFAASRGNYGSLIWTTDGTTLGTNVVKDIFPSGFCVSISNLFAFNNLLLFLADKGDYSGAEIWRSDGTSAGTYLLKDINPTASSAPRTFLNLDANTELFIADDGTNGYEYWKTDGTTAGTTLIKDAIAGANGLYSFSNYNHVKMNGVWYSVEDSSTYGGEIWRSDGTSAGTFLLKDIGPSGLDGLSTSYGSLYVDGNTLYFPADDNTNGLELWKSDGTTAGTVMVKDIMTGFWADGIEPYSSFQMAKAGSVLYFVAGDSNTTGRELWKTDGTTAGTVLVKDIYSGTNNSSISNMTAINNVLIFTATNGTNGVELWKSDGTSAGTVMLKDINSGSGSSFSTGFMILNNVAYFSASDSTHGIELWRTDGTASGTYMVKDINPGAASSGASMMSYYSKIFDNQIYFKATTANEGSELWRTDGTEAGTVLVADINPGTGSSSPSISAAYKDSLIILANDGTHGSELWTTQGISAATRLLIDIVPGSGNGSYQGLQSIGNILYFIGNDNVHGSEPWAYSE